MATRRKAADDPTTDGADGAVPVAFPIVEVDDDSEDSVLDRLRSMGGDDRDRMRIKVYRKTNAGTLEWCTDYTVGEWEERDVAGVRADWGPGTYEMRVVSSGRRGILLRDVFRIANDSKPAAPAAPAQAAPQSSELADVVRMLAEGQQRILEAVSQRPDPTAQLQSTLALMVSMREAMGINNAPPPPPPAADPSAMLAQIVGAVRQLREVAQEVSPPQEDGDSPMAMLGKFADVVKLGMSQQAQPAFDPVTVPDSLNAESPEMLQILILRGQLQTLVNMAAKGESPEAGGRFVAENLPAEMDEHLALPNIVDVLSAVNPKVREHAEWMLKARDAALRIIKADGAEDDGAPLLPPKGAI